VDLANNTPHRAANNAGQGEPCPGCRRLLPIRFKKPGEATAHWECTACHTPVTGLLLKEAAVKLAETIRIGRAHFDTTALPAVPSRLRDLVTEFIESRRSNPPTDERRKLPRSPVELDVIISLLDENWVPQAKPLLAIGIDLTSHGLGVVTTTQIDAQYAAVEVRLPGGIAQILCQVVWTKDIGHGYFNSGMHFLLRFGRSSTKSVSGVRHGESSIRCQLSDTQPMPDN
jgi:hypothetical protein